MVYRKREAEMAKLRKLLEDVHTESEQQIHQLRYSDYILYNCLNFRFTC
jgi:hypothetical protein